MKFIKQFLQSIFEPKFFHYEGKVWIKGTEVVADTDWGLSWSTIRGRIKFEDTRWVIKGEINGCDRTFLVIECWNMRRADVHNYKTV